MDTPEALVEKADRLHRKAEAARKDMARYAKQAGDHLLAAKKKLKHGKWKPWIKKHFHASYETAVIYMRLAKDCNWERIERELDRNKSLSLNEAVKAIKIRIKGNVAERRDELRKIEAGRYEHSIRRLGHLLKKHLTRTIPGWMIDTGWTEGEVIYLDDHSWIGGQMLQDALDKLNNDVRVNMFCDAMNEARTKTRSQFDIQWPKKRQKAMPAWKPLIHG